MKALEKLRVRGIRRDGTPKTGFSYQTVSGEHVNRADQQRIKELNIPPAWKGVLIDPKPKGVIQAIGQDAKGRWQYLYHDVAVQRREEKKYQHLLAFAQALPQLRLTLRKDLISISRK